MVFLHCEFLNVSLKVAKELCSAFQGTGFAYLVDHGIEPHLVQQVVGNSYLTDSRGRAEEKII